MPAISTLADAALAFPPQMTVAEAVEQMAVKERTGVAVEGVAQPVTADDLIAACEGSEWSSLRLGDLQQSVKHRRAEAEQCVVERDASLHNALQMMVRCTSCHVVVPPAELSGAPGLVTLSQIVDRDLSRRLLEHSGQQQQREQSLS